MMPRILVLDHKDVPLGELDPRKVRGVTVTSEVNGEHAMEVMTSEGLAKNQRLLYRDAMGYWHEYVVQGTVAAREDGGEIVTEYYAIWSLQHDLSQTYIDNTKDHYLRIRCASKSKTGNNNEFMIDYLELVPKSIYGVVDDGEIEDDL